MLGSRGMRPIQSRDHQPRCGHRHSQRESFAAGHRMLRPDGSVLFSPASGPAPRLFAAAPTQGTTTTCDQGALVPDDVDPTIIRPEGGLSGGTYDNIEVPPNAVCVLEGVTVTHSVRALAGAYLFVFGSTVGGDILGLAPKAVQLNDETTVG